MPNIVQVDVPDIETLNRMLDRTKGRLFTKPGAGFLGSLLCDHKYVWDTSCTTAWCNGSTIGWNPAFFCWLSPEERVTVLAHELWHTGFDHMGRLGQGRCPDRWNKAADFVINRMLELAGFVFGEKLMSIGPCLDPQYDGMTTEQVYDLLPDNPGLPSPCPGADPSGDSDADGTTPRQDPNDPLHGDLRPVPKGVGKDDHLGKLVKAIQSSQMAKEAGVIPGEITLIVDTFLNPLLPWEVLLARFFTDLSKDDFSWKRPSRRYDDEYLPCLESDNGLEHLIYYMDVSGSVTDEDVTRFNSEVKFIHESLRPKKLTIVTFDTKIQDEREFTDEDLFEKIEIHGRGGTSLAPVYQHIKRHQPTAAVIFSDLYCHPMETNPGPPVLWVIVGNKNAQTCFGQNIHIDNEKA